MTGNYMRPITPDSITGMTFAAEGFQPVVTMINGPMGCRFYHSTTSQFLTLRPPLYLPYSDGGKKVPVRYQFLDNWFFRQSRVPCTWLDGEEYVYGTLEKVRAGLAYIKENLDFELLVIINSPGASLIGDPIEDAAKEILPEKKIVYLESPGFSEEYEDGYETAVLEILRAVLAEAAENAEDAEDAEGTADLMRENSDSARDVPEEAEAEKNARKKVTLLGISIFDRYFEGDLAEIRRLFDLMGVEAVCAPGALCPVSDLYSIPESDLVVALYPERSLACAKYLKETFGTPYYVPAHLPVGFEETEAFLTEIAEILGANPAPVLEELKAARALAYGKIRNIHEISGLPEGVSFYVEGNPSLKESYSHFLSGYLGMIPDTAEKAELLFGDANTIAQQKTRREAFCGIEIANPGMGYTDLIPKTHMGIRGTLFLIEQVLNGLMSRL